MWRKCHAEWWRVSSDALAPRPPDLRETADVQANKAFEFESRSAVANCTPPCQLKGIGDFHARR